MTIVNQYTKNATVTFLITAISAVIGLVTSIMVARLLGPEGRGILALAILLPTLIYTLTNFGITPATTYYLALNHDDASMILGNTMIISFLVSLISLGFGNAAAIIFHASFFHSVSYIYLLVALLIIPPNVILQNLQGILLGAQKFSLYNITTLIQTLLLLLLTTLFLLVFRMGVYGAIWANIFALSASCVIIMLWVWSILGKPIWLLNKAYLKKALIYGLQAHLSNVLAFLNYRVDMFIINFFLNPTEVGLYAIGVAIVEQIWMISQAASTVLFPMVSQNEKGVRDLTPIVSRSILVLNTLMASILFILSKVIILVLYGRAYLSAVSTIQALFIGVIALGTGRILANDIAGRGKPVLNTYINIVSVIVNVILNILWIPAYGIVGAAWASTVSYSVVMLGEVYVYAKISENSWHSVLFIQRGDITLYLSMFVQLIQHTKSYLSEDH